METLFLGAVVVGLVVWSMQKPAAPAQIKKPPPTPIQQAEAFIGQAGGMLKDATSFAKESEDFAAQARNLWTNNPSVPNGTNTDKSPENAGNDSAGQSEDDSTSDPSSDYITQSEY